MKELVLSSSVDIKASAARVWKTLTDPELTKQYMFGCEVVSDWKAGSPVLWKGSADGKIYVKGNVLKIEPKRLLQYTVFDPNSPMEDVPENYLTVTYELVSSGDMTTLNVGQADYASVQDGAARYKDSVEGWPAVMKLIKEVAEKESNSAEANG